MKYFKEKKHRVTNTHWIIAIALSLLIAIIALFGVVLFTERNEVASTSSLDKPTLSSEPETVSRSLNQSGIQAPPSGEISQETKRSEQNYSAVSEWLVAALFILAIATFCSVAISFYLYRWRKILLGNPHMVIPEEAGNWFRSLDVHVKKLTSTFDLGVRQVQQETREINQNVSNLVETFMTLQKALDERDAEIRRLKLGYDAEIFRKFVSRFIRVDQAIEDFQRSGQAGPDDLEQVKRLLEDAFAECGVEAFEPVVGSDYRTVEGVADNPKTKKTESPEDAFKIAEVLTLGYLLRSSEGHKVIIPAKVRIYIT